MPYPTPQPTQDKDFYSPFDLPCGCVGEYGPGSKICNHPCHDVYRQYFGKPELYVICSCGAEWFLDFEPPKCEDDAHYDNSRLELRYRL